MKRTFTFILVAAFVLLAAQFSQHSASAQGLTIVVNSAADNVKFGCDPTHCTLREAILEANSTVGVKETIEFNINPVGNPKCIPVPGICNIELKTELPTITDAVVIDGYSQPGASPNTNAIGTNAKLRIVLDGTDKSFNGLMVGASFSEIRGLAFNRLRWAIVLYSHNNKINGNFIGMNAHGEKTRGNVKGIVVGPGMQENHIGSSALADRNLISGNDQEGIFINGNRLTVVQGNYIGTDKSGFLQAGNNHGVWVRNSNQTTIGGALVGEGNLISGNGFSGILISGGDGALILQNTLGVAPDNKTAVSNHTGVRLDQNALNNTAQRNVIAKNWGWGIWVHETSRHNSLPENSIFGNHELGIDLFPDGDTANDELDKDKGANDLQNYPFLKSVETSIGGTTIKAKLNSRASRTYRIEFFSNPSCDANGQAQGKTYLGTQDVTTTLSGNINFVWQTNKILKSGAGVTATATELGGNSALKSTSEFSKCLVVP